MLERLLVHDVWDGRTARKIADLYSEHTVTVTTGKLSECLRATRPTSLIVATPILDFPFEVLYGKILVMAPKLPVVYVTNAHLVEPTQPTWGLFWPPRSEIIPHTALTRENIEYTLKRQSRVS